MTKLGMLGTRRRVVVDDHGVVTFPGMHGALRFWVGAEDGWHNPEEQASTRQHRLGVMSGVGTRVRVANGDIELRAYGVYVSPDVFAVEIVNESPTAVVVAVVAEHLAASFGNVGILSGNTVLLPRPPRDHRTAAGRNALWAAVTGAGSGDVPGSEAAGRFEATDAQAFVYPLPHGATIRVAVALDPGTLPTGAPDSLPSLDAVERGWETQLRRGLQVALPDPRIQAAVDASRVELLLQHELNDPTPDTMVALEDWGFDDEARREFEHLGFLDRRRVSHRPVDAAPWSHIEGLLAELSPTMTFPEGPAPFLNHLRSLIAFERPDHTVDLLTHLPPDWFGQSIDVTGAPTRGGLVSYAVRWHGSRPALLWECKEPGLRLHAPGLDTVWMTDQLSGEALLAPVGA